MAPAVPVTVRMYCPRATDDVVEIERIELKLGAPDAGFREADTPLGAPETVKTTF